MAVYKVKATVRRAGMTESTTSFGTTELFRGIADAVRGVRAYADGGLLQGDRIVVEVEVEKGRVRK